MTHPGSVRSVNEDAVAVLPDLGLLAVADGMGGHNAGEVAARIAVDRIVAHVRKALPAGAGASAEALEATMRAALLAANAEILARAREDAHCEGMGATVVCLLMRGGHACIGHLGDSRAYRLRGGKLRLLTRDHSLTQDVRELGVIGEDAISSSHNRHLISQALGHGEAPPLAIQTTPCEEGDLYVLCTDGLNDMVDGEDIELALRTLRSNLPLAADQLVMIARDNGGFDNITVALARYSAAEAAPRTNGTSPFGRLAGWLKSLLGGRS